MTTETAVATEREYLYALLRKPDGLKQEMDAAALKDRPRIAAFFSQRIFDDIKPKLEMLVQAEVVTRYLLLPFLGIVSVWCEPGQISKALWELRNIEAFQSVTHVPEPAES